MNSTTATRFRAKYVPHGIIYTILGIAIVTLTILTVVYAVLWRKGQTTSTVYAVENGIIGSRAVLPNDGRYIQWTLLQMNDVYEMLPVDGGQKGGLARVAHIRKLLKEENPHTYTICAGDLLSPSALGLATVNGTVLRGKQMVATMNALGLDYMVFGNHEFDLSEQDLLTRMAESNFTWIATNVFRLNSNQPFGSSIPHKIITIETVRILFIGLSIDENGNYVRFINQSSLVNFVKEFLTTIPSQSYDVLVAITHVSIATDVQLATNIPQIDVIIGGHEHENYYYLRGSKLTPINKADSNAFTVIIHRCAYNVDKKRFRIYSTFIPITPEVPEDQNTAAVANYWFDLGMQGFAALGYKANATVSCLPSDVELDGRSSTVRNQLTLLTILICESMLESTVAQGTTIAVLNGGGVRIDDILRGKVTEYDIIRTLPFPNKIAALSVPGDVLDEVLVTGASMKGTGMFMAYTGVQTPDGGTTWFFNGTDISKTGLNYTVVTLDYVRDNTHFKDPRVTTLLASNVTLTRSFLDYLKIKYPPC